MVNVKEKRIEKGLTQKQLADKVFCVRQHIASIENNRALPSVALSKRLAVILGFNWTEMFEDV